LKENPIELISKVRVTNDWKYVWGLGFASRGDYFAVSVWGGLGSPYITPGGVGILWLIIFYFYCLKERIAEGLRFPAVRCHGKQWWGSDVYA